MTFSAVFMPSLYPAIRFLLKYKFIQFIFFNKKTYLLTKMINTEIKILVVDDLPVMRKIITHQLKRAGFENITVAPSAIEVMEMLHQEKFDLVLSDWKMPDKDGLELLKAMRTDKALAKIPFIIIAAEDGVENVRKAINAGVTNYIVKPLSSNILENKIYEVFTGKPKATASV